LKYETYGSNTGEDIFIPSQSIVFYEADLVGLEVLDEQKNKVAKVIGFYNFGAGDILEIKLQTGKAEMLPFNKAYVPEINLEEGYIIVTSTGMVFSEDEEDSKKC
jgi:16S rRNA processing protein RimM